MGFSDVLYELSGYLGKGLEKGIGEEQELQSKVRGFKRLAPTRKAERAEGIELEEGPEAAQAYLAGTYPGKTLGKEARAAAKVEQEERGLAELARGLGYDLTTEQLPSPERAEIEPITMKPLERLPKAGISLLAARERAARLREPRQPTQVEMQRALTNPGHPLHEEAKRYFYGIGGTPEKPAPGSFIDVQGQVTGARTVGGVRARLDMPRVPTPQEAGDIREAEANLINAKTTMREFNSQYAGILQGGVRGRMRALTGMITGEEATFRADAKILANDLYKQFLGTARTVSEMKTVAEAIPDPDKVSAVSFVAALKGIIRRAETILELHKAQLSRPAGQPFMPQAPSGTDPDLMRVQ